MNESLHKRADDGTAGARHEGVALWLAAIVDSSNDAIISKNLDGVISSWNAAAEKLFGYSEVEAVGHAITLIIPTDRHDEEREILRRLRAGERLEHFETRRVARDGRFLDVSITVSPVRDSGGTIVGASKILRDISETRRMHRALRESERHLASELARVKTLQSISTRLISERTPGSLFAQLLDAAMEVMRADAASVQMLMPETQSLKLLGWRDFHPESATFWDEVTAEAGSTCGVALRDNMRVHVSDVESCGFMAGTQDLVEYRRSRIRAVQSTPLHTRTGEPLGMLSTHWRIPHTPTDDDLTLFDVLARQAADLIERTVTESSLRQAKEALATINQRLLTAQDEERSRIARELHDDVGQRLAVLQCNLEMLVQEGQTSVVGRGIQEARAIVSDLAKDVHDFSHRLHPARLEYLGIVKAAAGLCREVGAQHDVQVSFQVDGASEELPDRLSVCLYRVLQEALQNAVKHSRAAVIDVVLRHSRDEVELTIHDNGVGFNIEALTGFGLGLTSMKERLAAVNGQLRVLSAPGHGTTVRARLSQPLA